MSVMTAGGQMMTEAPELLEPGSRDRRQSARWLTDKALEWRVRGGRRIRESRVIERSLNGMVMMTAAENALPAGALILPRDETTGDRHGFRVAVVRRAKDVQNGDRLMFLEILA